jgi:hypothetical protein
MVNSKSRSRKNKKIALIVGGGIMAIAAPAIASLSAFHNQGTMAGFDGTNLDPNCNIVEQNSTYYPGNGTSAFYASANYVSGYTGRYHADVYKNSAGYAQGDEGFYGFAFRLKSSWDFSQQGYNIAQFIGDYTSVPGHCDDWMPTTMVWLYGSELHTRVKYGTNCSQATHPSNAMDTGSGGWVIPSTLGGGTPLQVTAAAWHTIELQVLWKSDATGYFKVWYDGTKLFEQYNLETTMADQTQFRYEVGLYANKWHDDGYLVGSQGFREMWFDRIASTPVSVLGGCSSAFQNANPAGTCW